MRVEKGCEQRMSVSREGVRGEEVRVKWSASREEWLVDK